MSELMKSKYGTPILRVLFVELEQGIAAESASLSPSGNEAYTPSVEGWDDGGSIGNGKFEL